ncbi:MAG: GAF domain-containing protein [candidate division Zixibacteria bacterium]|nr:GAF domain-containing protein [candidate division Zixibacteria bacterium]
MRNADEEKAEKHAVGALPDDDTMPEIVQKHGDIFADLEATLDEVAEANPRIDSEAREACRATSDLSALLEVSLAVNSSLVLDDVLQIVMRKAIELMQAERGLIMLLDDDNELQVRTAHNLRQEDMTGENFRISSSIASQVAATGRSIYASDAMSDERYAQQASVLELHLRSIMCVPIKDHGTVVGIIYVDNSNQTKVFLKSDLYLFELFAQMAANALRNAATYDALLTLKKYNELVIKKSPVGIVVIDDNLRIATINPVALEVLDFNRNNIARSVTGQSGSDFLEMLPEHERSRWREMIATALTSREDYSDPRYFHDTGYQEKALSIKISRLSALPNGDNGLIMTIEDITEMVVMEKYVILSEKLAAKGEMAASIVHELNNYLAIASTNAELMGMNLDRQAYDKARFNAKSTTENIFKIKRFVDSMMDFSKPEPEYISYDIKHLLDDLLFSLRVQPRFKRTRFTIDLGQEIPNLEMDVGQIQQVLMNLLNNAADAIEERAIGNQTDGDKFKREIGIAATYDDERERLTVEISDDGIGMPPETIEKIFNMHFTTKRGGHGLGLANCLKIIESHHGEITVESTPGEGTRFRVTLPRFHDAKPKQT